MQHLARRNINYVSLVPRVVNLRPLYRGAHADVVQMMEGSPGMYTVARGMMKELGAQFSNGFKDLWRNYKRRRNEMKQKIQKKESLSRADLRFLERTSEDLKLLIPFGLFSMLPASTVLLPVFIKLFPHLLPSTFHTQDVKEKNLARTKMTSLRGLSEVFLPLSASLGTMIHAKHDELFLDHTLKLDQRLRVEDKSELDKLQYLFGNELNISHLDRNTLIGMCHYLGIYSFCMPKVMLQRGLTNWALKKSLDDWTIKKEGIDSLSAEEYQCCMRGEKTEFKTLCIYSAPRSPLSPFIIYPLFIAKNDTETQKRALATWLSTLPALNLSPLRSTAPDYIVKRANDDQSTVIGGFGDVSMYIWGAFLLQPK